MTAARHSIILNATSYNHCAYTQCTCGWVSDKIEYQAGRNRSAVETVTEQALAHVNNEFGSAIATALDAEREALLFCLAATHATEEVKAARAAHLVDVRAELVKLGLSR